MDSCGVLVVGGGPAGSTCAGRLREAGIDVLLLDSRLFPRDKPCAGWITPQVLETLGVAAGDYGRGRVLQEIHGFATSVLNGAAVVTRYPRIVSYGIRRREFDHYLLERSAVRRVLGEPFVSLERQGEHWIVNGRYRCRLVVGAGGHFCPVARLLGAKIGAEEVIAAQATEFAPAGEWDGMERDLPELMFSRDMKGYGWIFRKGEFLNVGFGIIGKSGFNRNMAEFRAHLEERGLVKPGATVGFTGHAYLPYRRRGGRTLVGDGLLLIGDAAGLADPQSGEGILPAIESALMAGQIISEAGGDYRADRLAPYAARVAARFGGRMPEVTSVLPSALAGFIGARLLAVPPFVRHVVLERWFLHAGRKPLAIECKQGAWGASLPSRS